MSYFFTALSACQDTPCWTSSQNSQVCSALWFCGSWSFYKVASWYWLYSWEQWPLGPFRGINCCDVWEFRLGTIVQESCWTNENQNDNKWNMWFLGQWDLLVLVSGCPQETVKPTNWVTLEIRIFFGFMDFNFVREIKLVRWNKM